MKIFAVIIATVIVFTIGGKVLIAQENIDYTPYLKASPQNMQKWDDLTFGMFIHWDMSSLLGVEISWAKEYRGNRSKGDIPDVVYNNLYKSFNPQEFDAKKIVKIAQDAGMKYIIITAKHHGGFCMFDSKLTDYKITNTCFKRDVIKELSDACHQAGMAFGFYYSQPDWHHPDFAKNDFESYRKYLYGQLTELCSNYGKISMIFFDGLEFSEKEWKSKEMFKLIRTLQPDVVINERGGLPGDYKCPEQMVGAFNNKDYWETNMTIGTSWSWKVNDNIKNVKECLTNLIQTVGGDGNFLFNVGPMPTGIIEPRQVDTLKAMGNWLKKYGESIYTLEGGPYKPAAWGASTHKGKVVYLHILSWFDVPEYFPPLGIKIEKAELLTGGEVKVEESKTGIRFIIDPKYHKNPSTIIKLTLSGNSSDIQPIIIPTKSLARNAKVTTSVNQSVAQNLVDDDPQTEWNSDSKQCWIEVDMLADKEFNRIDIREEGPEWEERTNDFVLQYKSENKWITLDKGNRIGHTYSLSFDKKVSRFIRLQVNNAGVLPKFSEIQVYNRIEK